MAERSTLGDETAQVLLKSGRQAEACVKRGDEARAEEAGRLLRAGDLTGPPYATRKQVQAMLAESMSWAAEGKAALSRADSYIDSLPLEAAPSPRMLEIRAVMQSVLAATSAGTRDAEPTQRLVRWCAMREAARRKSGIVAPPLLPTASQLRIAAVRAELAILRRLPDDAMQRLQGREDRERVVEKMGKSGRGRHGGA